MPVEKQLFDLIKTTLNTKSGPDKVVQLLFTGFDFLAQVKTMTGLEKKALLVRTIRRAITESDLPDHVVTSMLTVLDNLGDEIINSLATAVKRVMNKGCKFC